VEVQVLHADWLPPDPHSVAQLALIQEVTVSTTVLAVAQPLSRHWVWQAAVVQPFMH